MSAGALPWRGPGPERPDLPLPPGRMPLRRDGEMRKRWRYVGCYGEALMLCAARAQIGPFTQCFWVLWERDSGKQLAHTAMRPGSQEVWMEGPRVEIEARDLRASLTLGEAEPIESICASAQGSGWGWTRKRAGVPFTGEVEASGRRWKVNALGVDDESAGYQQRHTSWHWSAGVGSAADGRAVAWNLVEGINDPPRGSERAIWVDGEPHEPAPVRFDGLAGVEFADRAGRLEFRSESERSRNENFLLIRSHYRHRFGSFAGSLDGIELAGGLGVMEEHEALW